MRRRYYTKLVFGLLLMMLWLTSCGRFQSAGGLSPTASPDSAQEQATSGLAPEPENQEGVNNQETAMASQIAGAYPAPADEDVATQPAPYPQPAVPADTPEAQPYPRPGDPSDVSETPQPYPPPATQKAGEENTGTPIETQSTATPSPTHVQPGREVTPTLTGTSSPTLTLLATPTTVRTEMEASDPQSFEPAAGVYQLVEFYATWALESKSMAPVMYHLESRYQDRVSFVYLDLDDPANDLYARMLASVTPPIFYLLDPEGRVQFEKRGYITLEEFQNALDDALR